MNDSSAYLNYPGLKYLNKMNDVNWGTDSSSFINYSGLKYLDGSEESVNENKDFLNHDGLEYIVFSRMNGVLEQYKKDKDEEKYKYDSSIRIEYDHTTGEINLICESNNNSIITEGNKCGGIDRNGMMSIMVVKNGGISGGYYINENGEIIKNG